jgi:hypothetical protein
MKSKIGISAYNLQWQQIIMLKKPAIYSYVCKCTVFMLTTQYEVRTSNVIKRFHSQAAEEVGSDIL